MAHHNLMHTLEELIDYATLNVHVASVEICSDEHKNHGVAGYGQDGIIGVEQY